MMHDVGAFVLHLKQNTLLCKTSKLFLQTLKNLFSFGGYGYAPCLLSLTYPII